MVEQYPSHVCMIFHPGRSHGCCPVHAMRTLLTCFLNRDCERDQGGYSIATQAYTNSNPGQQSLDLWRTTPPCILYQMCDHRPSRFFQDEAVGCEWAYNFHVIKIHYKITACIWLSWLGTRCIIVKLTLPTLKLLLYANSVFTKVAPAQFNFSAKSLVELPTVQKISIIKISLQSQWQKSGCDTFHQS